MNMNSMDSRLNDYDKIRLCLWPLMVPCFATNWHIKILQVDRIILKDMGCYFWNASVQKRRDDGPYRIPRIPISRIFQEEAFNIEKIKDTVYQGSMDPLPKALFNVLTNHKS